MKLHRFRAEFRSLQRRVGLTLGALPVSLAIAATSACAATSSRRFVFDDYDGAEPLLQTGLHHSRDRIDRAAGRKRYDDPSSNVAGSGLGDGRLTEWDR